MIAKITKATAVVILTVLVCAGTQAPAATLHVDPNDPSMLSSIQDAIIVSKSFGTVIVHPGVYREAIDFIAKAITVQSTDPNDPDIVARTIIDGGGKTVVAFQSGEKERAILSGFTIRNGDTGIRCAPEYTRPQIRQCVITSNKSSGISGGAPSITRCTVTQNGADGITSRASTVMGCTIAQNTGSGINGGAGDILDCVVVNNGGSGVEMSYLTATNVRMAECLISGNQGDGVLFSYNTFAKVVNCVVSGNKGYGIRGSNGAHVVVTNCTIVRNRDTGTISSYPAEVSNSIVAYNGGIGLWNAESRYNNLFGNAGGDYSDVGTRIADIQEEPLFVDIGYWDKSGTWHDGDYHLMSKLGRWDPVAATWVIDPVDSPCLDRGDPNAPVGREPNPNGDRINLGGYGGTAQASKSPGVSPLCTGYPEMDFNKDCKVDLADFAAFMEHWLDCNLDDSNACWPAGIPATPVVPDTQP